jgi:membrane fusion protein, copper/silver efflux system
MTSLSRSRWWLVPLLSGLLWGLAGAGLAQDPGAHDAAAHGVPATTRLPGSAPEVFYTCVMHPHVRSSTPGECPICGMGLVRVENHTGHREQGEEADEPQPTRLTLSPRAAALLQLEVHRAERRAVDVPVHLFGRVDHDETRLRTVSAWVPGRVERLHVDFTGAPVRRGEPMVELYSPALIAAQEELLQALEAERALAAGMEVVRESARLTVAASRDRLRLLGLDARQIEALEARGRVDDRVTIPAPVSGIVIERLAAVGDYLAVGTPIYRVSDLSRVWLQLEAYETDLHWLAPGQAVSLTTRSLPGEGFEGVVGFIDPLIDPRRRTARVRVEVANPDGRLKPGMFVRGRVGGRIGDHAGHGDDHRPPLLVPASAPLITGRRAVVYVQVGDAAQPEFEPRDVRLGPRAGDWYVVEEGLAEGELVVARGAFKIDAELQIRGLPSMMQPAGGPAPVHDHGGDD